MHHACGWICGISMRSMPQGKLWLGTVTVHDYTYVLEEHDGGVAAHWKHCPIIITHLRLITSRLRLVTWENVCGGSESGWLWVPAGWQTWRVRSDQVEGWCVWVWSETNTKVRLFKWSHEERRSDSIQQTTSRLADACGCLLAPRIFHICSCLPLFRRWINMRTLVQRAAHCDADRRLPLWTVRQWARWAGAEYPRISHLGLAGESWGLIGPSSSMFTLVIRASATCSTAAKTLWTIPTFSKVLLLLKITLNFQYSICVIYCRTCSSSWLIYSSNLLPLVGGFVSSLLAAFICKCGQHKT